MAARIDDSLLSVIVSEADGFCADAYTAVQILQEREERLRRLAGKY